MKQRIIKQLLELRGQTLTFDDKTGGIYHEAFSHPAFTDAAPVEQAALADKWATELYDIETVQPIDAYFPGYDVDALCAGKDVLDIGSYIGGKNVRWAEKYRMPHLWGIDNSADYVTIAKRLAAQKGVSADFKVGFAEAIPFDDEQFDVVISAYTFEHVRDLDKALAECKRVLRPNGVLVTLFPPFYYPVGHHLDLVSRTPCVHWVFDYPDLLDAYFAILDERGAAADWYRRPEESPMAFEKGYSINGTTARQFHTMATATWDVIYDNFADSFESSSHHPVKKLMDTQLKRLQLPIMRELYEVATILRKRPLVN